MSHSTLHCPLSLTHMRVFVRTSRELVVEVVCTREVFMDVCVCVCVCECVSPVLEHAH